MKNELLLDNLPEMGSEGKKSLQPYSFQKQSNKRSLSPAKTSRSIASLFNSIPAAAREEILANQDKAEIPVPRNSDYVFLKNEIKYKKFKETMYARQIDHRRKVVKLAMSYADQEIERQKKFIKESFKVYSNANMGFLDSSTKSKFAQCAVDVYEINVRPQKFYDRALEKLDIDFEEYDREYREQITYQNRKKQLELSMMGPKPNNYGKKADVQKEVKDFYNLL